MAALQTLVFVFIAVTFFGGGFGVTDEEFHRMTKMMERLTEKIGDLTQEVEELKGGLEKEIERNKEVEETQDLEIKQLSAVVSKHETALSSNNRKCKPEVLEHDVVQNDTIEERVSLLEVQVADLEEDITVIRGDVADLDQDVNFLFDEQVIQDQRLLNLEETSDGVVVELAEINANILDLDTRVVVLEENGGGDGNSSVAELEVRVETLEGTTADHEIRISTSESDIQGLQVTDVNHDVRISALEEDGGSGGSQNDTIAFHSVLTSYSTIPSGSNVIFNEVLLNQQNGYDSSTGLFTVPYGGDGFYYFSTYLYVDDDEVAILDMTLNDDVICSTRPDHGGSTGADYPSGSCRAVVNVVAGDEVEVVLRSSADSTPLFVSTTYLYIGFNGFRI